MSQKQYQEEYEKYKHIVISPGEYSLKKGNIKYVVLSVDEEKQTAEVLCVHSNFKSTKTLHWCRKQLQALQ